MSAQRLDEAWQIKAACRGPQAEVFFPPSHFERTDEKLEREVAVKVIPRDYKRVLMAEARARAENREPAFAELVGAARG